MTTLLTTPTSPTAESNDLLLITNPFLRRQLLKTRPLNNPAAISVVRRSGQIYLSLPGVMDDAQRQRIKWAVLRMQFGDRLNEDEMPEPLQQALNAHPSGQAPLLQAIIWGFMASVVGGVLVMAMASLLLTILNFSAESTVSVLVNAAAFTLSAAVIGIGVTIYCWRRLT